MPTLTELKSAYPDMDNDQLVQRWRARHPGEPIQTETIQPEMPAKGWQEKLVDIGRSRGAGSTVGAAGALALIKKGASLPISLTAGAAGGAAGALGSRILRQDDEDFDPSWSGAAKDAGIGAVEGALGPAAGPVLKGTAAALRGVGQIIPRVGRVGGWFANPAAMIGIEAAVNKRGLPMVLDAVGGLAERGVNAVKGSLRPLAQRIGAAFDDGPPRLRQRTSKEVPYRMERAEPFVSDLPAPPHGSTPPALQAIQDAVPEVPPPPLDWRKIAPDPASKANFVKKFADKSQLEMAQALGERDLGWNGVRIKNIKQPLYPSGPSKGGTLEGAMRQREKVSAMNDPDLQMKLMELLRLRGH